ncbi:MAG: ebgA 3 [Verrucomicrobia bacterium]|nr:ebgA 3 [Verrucomicrobiota bacterium]
MKLTRDLATASWTLTGYTPDTWRFLAGIDLGAPSLSEVAPVPARVPASVQQLLLEQKLIPDWNYNLDSRGSEWVENRNWVFETVFPREWLGGGAVRRLRCAGLDHAGWVCCNGQLVGRFENGFVEHVFDLSAVALVEENKLQVVFDLPPRWLGQFHHTSQIRDWKARFNYTWDWQPRLVQIGIWDRVTLEVSDGDELATMRCQLSPKGFTLFGNSSGRVEISLTDGARCIVQREVDAAELAGGAKFDDLAVEPWWPNREGPQKTYRVTCALKNEQGVVADEWTRTVGFKDVTWRDCEDAPAGADPWICVVNGRALFLQGVNWTPIRPNYADLTPADYEVRIRAYADMGCNVFRVWGGAFLETEVFYDLCDRHGILVWQEFPFSSSGIDNWPPEDAKVIAETRPIVRDYIPRRQHHASLLCWCGGNELMGHLNGSKVGSGKPAPASHPLLAMIGEEARALDPSRRFLATSPTGPRAVADEKEFGQGLHWDTHGPWFPVSETYWSKDDALFRSEVGAAGASPLDILEKFYAPGSLLPLDETNPRWRRYGFWIQGAAFQQAHGRPPRDLAEYVDWSQGLQAAALEKAARSIKGRFPKCGGIILWMGHDPFPNPANTAVLDFYGRMKPAAVALQKIFLK